MVFRRSLGRGLEGLGGLEAAFQVCQDVVDMFDADGETDIARRNARLELVFRRQLRVRRRGRVDREASGVADIGDVVVQFERIDETAASLAAGFEFEAYQATIATREIFVCPLTRRAGLQARIDDAADFGTIREEFRNLLGIAAVAFDPQR